MKTTEQRFKEKYVVNITTGCYEWTGALNSKGYGSFGRGDGTTCLAHRWAWEHDNGSIPKGLQIDHRCNNKRCVNTGHMRTATPRQNTLATHSATPSGVNSRKTHCDRGHPLEGENLLLRTDGRRNCRVCKQADDRRYWHERQARA